MAWSGPSQVEAKRSTHYDELNAAMAKASYGRFVLPVELIQSPEEMYRAREAKQVNVDVLEKSLQEFGTVNEHVEVVLFVPAGRPLPAKAGFKPPVTLDEMKNRGFDGYYTVVGDHTQRAMNQLHRKFKPNQKWASLAVLVFIFQRVVENYNVLKSPPKATASWTTSRARSGLRCPSTTR